MEFGFSQTKYLPYFDWFNPRIRGDLFGLKPSTTLNFFHELKLVAIDGIIEPSSFSNVVVSWQLGYKKDDWFAHAKCMVSV